MNRKSLTHILSIVFFAAFSSNLGAQDKPKLNQSDETYECKAEASKCDKIARLTKRFLSGKLGMSSREMYLRSRAQLYLEIGEINAALSDINKVLEKYPGASDFVFRGNIYLRKAEF
jgi:hypothetical protein